MKRAGLYIRVSTSQQEKEGYSLEAQEEKLKAYAIAKDYHVHKIYTDSALSGAKLERPALQQMISDIENGELDIVIVYKLDRISRSQKNTMYLIEDVFLKNNVDFVSMQESFDTTSSFGRAMIGILSVFAQLERDNITERMMMGKLERVKRGYYMGGGGVPFGYRYNEATGLLELVEREANAIKRMFELFLNGHSVFRITETLKEEFPEQSATIFESTVKRRLTSVYYIGKQQYQNKVYDALHEPIVTQEVFDKAQRKLADRPHRNVFNHMYLLSSIIVCKKCGNYYNAYESSSKSNGVTYKNKYYRCSARTYKHRKKYGWACDAKNFRCDDFDELILSKIREHAKDDVISVSNKKTDNTHILKEIEKINAQQEKLVDLYLSDRISTVILDKKTEELELKKKLLEEKTKNKEVVVDEEEYKTSLKMILDDFDSLDFETKRIVLENVIDRIEVLDNEIDVYFIM